MKSESVAGETKGETEKFEKEMQEKDAIIEQLKQNLTEITEKHEQTAVENELQFKNKIELLEKQLEELRQVRVNVKPKNQLLSWIGYFKY